ncbi:hypothetical protein HHX47_DHR1001549 [Lentinula edodes]|nr:hypothetical protein HHX47_DHR1001549 [Lentinula edodes]
MTSKRPSLTAEQLALSEARKAKKAKQNVAAPTTASLVDEVKGRIIDRKWIQIKDADNVPSGHRVKILTWNEVDRLEKLLPVLESAGYAHRYAAGPNKKHGCLIAFKKDLYEEMGLKLILYDKENVRDTDEEGVSLCGSTFRTRNIGHIVALKHTQCDEGLVIATTHLFWHPKLVMSSPLPVSF